MRGEFDWIRELGEVFGAGRLPDGTIGIGDDAAVLPLCRDSEAAVNTLSSVVMSIDSQVSGVHFRPEWIGYDDLGRRLVHIGFSDIAAMGALPQAAMVSVEVGPEIGEADRQVFTEGLKSAVSELAVRLIGGNVARRISGFSAHITAIGRQEQDRILLRSGALPGDQLYVTGEVGAAAAGVRILSAREASVADRYPALCEAYRRPRAHWREGLVLAESGWVTAAIDISDGLAADLGHLCRQSGVGAVIEAEAVPIPGELQAWCQACGIDPVRHAMAGGEEYVLLFAAPLDQLAQDAVERRLAEFGGQLWRIGSLTKRPGLEVSRGGRREPLVVTGFDHLR
jgi:thiamine-monophosphate kinase